MAMSRNELREHLLATLEASPELDGENRRALADVFLRELDEHFTVVPRGTALPVSEPSAPYRRGHGPGLPVGLWPMALIVPVLLILSFAVHVPFFLFAIVLFFIARSVRRPGWRRSRPVYHL